MLEPAAEQSLEWWHPWKYSFELAAAACGLVLMAMLRGREREP